MVGTGVAKVEMRREEDTDCYVEKRGSLPPMSSIELFSEGAP